MTHTTDSVARIAREIRDLTPFGLSDRAGCACPDSPDSEGAEMLASVARDVADRLEDDPDTFADEDVSDLAHEISDSAPSVYTYRLWREFVDLGAYSEDVSELLPDAGEDLGRAAAVALYIIAERLVYALAEEIREQLAELEDEDEDESEDA